MQLVPASKHNNLTGGEGEFYHLQGDIPNLSLPLTAVAFNGVRRLLSTPILQKVQDFSSNDRVIRGIWLKHDCSVFVASCQTGERFEDEPLFQLDSRLIDWSWDPSTLEWVGDGSIPDVPVGEALMTMRIDDEGQFIPRSHHFMVRASGDDGQEPLYASKLGTARGAYIHDLVAATSFYAADAVACASLVVVDPNLQPA